jgi:ABC-type transport system involved in multi-copper enzyme maturation permease subunit
MSVTPPGVEPARRPGDPAPRQELLADLTMLVLVGAGVVLALWGLTSASPPPPAVYAVALAVILLAGLAFRWAGWLKLVGPLLFYDMLRSARRGRHVWARGLYAGLLLFLLFVSFLGSRRYTEMSDARRAARVAEDYFELFMAVQLAAVLVLTPAYVAGSVAEEKDRRTLEFLLATDLRNREIILSKLGARLANLVLFVLTGLPILSFLQFLGGVDPNLVLAGFAATGLTMLALGGLSVFTSIHFKKPRDAIAVTYLFIVAYYAVSLLLSFSQRAPVLAAQGLWLSSPSADLAEGAVKTAVSGNLLPILREVAVAGREGKLETVVPTLLWRYGLFCAAVAGLCTLLAVLRVRAAALKEMRGPTRARAAPRRLPPVGKRPMLWKEIFAERGVRFNWVTWLVTAVLLLATFLPAALILAHHLQYPYALRSRWEDTLPGQINLWVRTCTAVVGPLTLLAVGVRAATSYSGERDRHTLDSLLTTPMDSTPILVAKWLGAICSVRLAWLWLALIWGVGLALGGLHWAALPLLAVAWLVFAGFEATIGLWFSLLSRTSLRATVWTLLATLGVGLGHWLPWLCCLAVPGLSGSNVSYLLEVQGGLTPPAALFSLAAYGGELGSYGGRVWWEMLGFSLFGVFAWGVATVLLWSGLTLRFRALTLREEFVRPERGWVVQRPVVDGPLAGPRPIPPRPEPRPAPSQPPPEPPPRPRTRLSGAKLVEETWEKPRQQPPPG